ncbi:MULTISPECIES: hypothetical protein [Acidithrix]|uniref:Uncharacterized protein n=1 Tax=Acidithrix ferrooxidans TaxID=1280514 RepID=A0A0D8HKJ4_9ACTN|nr:MULTISPECIES: hypothetical protein [Acidithrix]KJF18485.1 hypothetical protein AXFE_06130 [Acidithrix ferrooxidans]CAG4907143.1 unnamed protein product [Acidithrix sp. C25]
MFSPYCLVHALLEQMPNALTPRAVEHSEFPSGYRSFKTYYLSAADGLLVLSCANRLSFDVTLIIDGSALDK